MKPLAQIEKVLHLRSVDLFSHCRAEEVIRIAAIADERLFGAGDEIYQKKEQPEALYCIVEGVVVLDSDDADRQHVGERETFGVREILSGRLRTTTASALEDTVALVIDAEDFFDLLSNNIDIVRALFREIISDTPNGTGDSS